MEDDEIGADAWITVCVSPSPPCATDGFRRPVSAGWTLLTLILAGFLALRLPIDTESGLIIQVTVQKVVFIVIAAALLYQVDAARAARGNGSRSSSDHS